MFEKAISGSRPQTGGEAHGELRDDMIVGSRDSVPGRGGDALRAIDWSELTARLNAARDLRRVLRRDAGFPIERTAASFGDAAATYFRSLGVGEQGGEYADEQDVNLVALEASKASHSKVAVAHNGAAHGDAREKE